MKEKITKHIQLRIEAPHYVHGVKRDETALKELMATIKDHKTLSDYYMWIEKEEVFVCSFCSCEWEEDESGLPVCCSKAQEEWEQNKGQLVQTD